MAGERIRTARSDVQVSCARMSRQGIYVECLIRGSMDELWRLTQVPDQHQRWDLRFTRIQYLPRPDPGEPQRFLYETTLLPGLAVRGTGESAGERVSADGQAVSALKFASDQPWSLLRAGSGYWNYIPAADSGIRFLTWYDFESRFGRLGRWISSVTLKPAMGWATAWSFDRLRLWIEQGQTPEVSMRFAGIALLVRATVAFVWCWHGLVPKLMFHNADELHMLSAGGLGPAWLNLLGGVELAWGLAMLIVWHARWMLVVTALVMVAATVGVVLTSPEYLTAAFNPLTLNVCVAALALVAYVAQQNAPTARTCLRKKPEER